MFVGTNPLHPVLTRCAGTLRRPSACAVVPAFFFDVRFVSMQKILRVAVRVTPHRTHRTFLENGMKQRDFGWLAELKPPVMIDSDLLSHAKTAHDAILLTWNTRRVKYTQADAAAMLEMPKSHLSNILSGQKYLPDELRVPFMWLCGSLALRQWEDREMEKLGVDFEIMALQKKLEEAKARRVA